ncbi:hypothetical protein A1D22_07645 [Pasteurellaceae bacterium LFhippo2]|nr:hypothetical protein [Pasteurellaceae bacterium LFhippo2]
MRKITLISPLALLGSCFLAGCVEDENKECEKLYYNQATRTLASEVCEKSAQSGNATGQFLWGKLLLAEGKTKQAVDFLEKSANQKNGSALFQLAELHEKGNEIFAKDESKAFFYYNQSCQNGEIKACERVSSLEQQKIEQEKTDALELEKAKAKVLAEEKAKIEAQAEADRQKRLAEEERRKAVEAEALKARQEAEEQRKKAEEDAIKARVGNRKFYYGLAKFQEGNLWGHINQQGEMVIPAKFAYAADFYDELAAVKTTDGKWGYINTSGMYQITPRFSCAAFFSEGVAGASATGSGDGCRGGKWGYIDKNGNWLLNPVFDRVWAFDKGIAKVEYEGQIRYINKQGSFVNAPVENISKGPISSNNTPLSTSTSTIQMTQAQIKDVYSNFNLTFRRGGMSAIKTWVENCYEKSANKIGCYHFDQLASLIDSFYAKDNNVAQNSFFYQSLVESRARNTVLEFRNLTYSDFSAAVRSAQNTLINNANLLSLD